MDLSDNFPKAAQSPAYRIETERLVLRCWEPRDAPLLKESVEASLEHLKPWMPWVHEEPEPLQVKIDRLRTFRARFDSDEDYIYAIFNLEETEVLGGTGLHTRAGEKAREIGYWIHVDHIGKGLATEATMALIKVAFEISRVERIEIHCDPINHLSAAIPKKLGFSMDGIIRKSMVHLEGKLRDTMIWTLLRDEYEDSPSAKIAVAAFDAVGRQFALS
ncbi:MAG: GNAT family N-acetyltransferase [Candidatus Promineifilaceae bacterium]